MADNPQPIIIKKVYAAAHGHHGGAWKVAYADFVTAMMAFFLLLWLLNATTEEQKEGISSYFSPVSVSTNSSGSGGSVIEPIVLMITLGTENAHEIADLMDEELSTHHHEDSQVSDAIQGMADALPALGIVAAVLGIIKTMGSITEPPEILGKLIGGALVGTFLGVWMAYGFVGPLSTAIKGAHEANSRYLQCMKAGIIAHIQGYAPAISIEFARKMLLTSARPSFAEVEEAVQQGT